MTISQEFCNSCKLELLQAIHDFSADTIKIALYTSAATLDKTVTAYSVTSEISGTGYSAGGLVLAVTATWPKLESDVAAVNAATRGTYVEVAVP